MDGIGFTLADGGGALWGILIALAFIFRILWKTGQGRDKKRTKQSAPTPTGFGKKKRRPISESSSAPPLPTPGPATPRKPIYHPDPEPDRAYRTSPRYWIDVIRVGEPGATRRAIEQLVALGPASIPALEEAGRDALPHVRQAAAQALERIQNELVIPGDPLGTVAPPALPATPPPSRVRPAPVERKPEPEPEPEPEPAPEAPVLPRADLEVPADAEVEAEPEPEPEPEPQPEPAYRWDAESATEPEIAPEPEATPEPVSQPEPSGDLVAALRDVASRPSFGGERDEVLAALLGRVEALELEVLRIQWTGVLGASEAYRNGRTIAARIAGTDVEVAALIAPAQSAQVDALKEGDRCAFRGAFVGWDSIYDRGRFEGELGPAS